MTDGRWRASATPADEPWPAVHKRAILTHGTCHARSGVRYWERTVAVATSAAPVSTALTLIDPGAAHVTPSRGNAYADPFPLHPCLPFAPFQPADLHRPRWRLPALSAIYPRVFTAVHTGPAGVVIAALGGTVTRFLGVAVTRDLGCSTLCSDWPNRPSLGLCVTRGHRLRRRPVATTGPRHLRRRPCPYLSAS